MFFVRGEISESLPFMNMSMPMAISEKRSPDFSLYCTIIVGSLIRPPILMLDRKAS